MTKANPVLEKRQQPSTQKCGSNKRFIIQKPREKNEDVMAQEGKSAVKELVASEIASMVGEALNDVLLKTSHNAERCVRSIVYNTVEQVMLDLLSKDFIGETLDAHTAKYLNTNEAAEGLSKRLLTSNSVLPPIATFVRRTTDKAMKEMKYSTSIVPK